MSMYEEFIWGMNYGQGGESEDSSITWQDVNNSFDDDSDMEECPYCNYRWYKRVKNPKRCPSCHEEL